MPRRIKRCAWEIYLGNIGNLYGNTALCFGFRFLCLFLLDRAVPNPFARAVAGTLLAFALVPLDLWWRKSLLELVKGERLKPKSCLSLYRDDYLCQRGMLLQLLCQVLNLWFWGIGYGITAEAGTAGIVAGQAITLLCWLTPFLLALAIQPVYVDMLITQGKSSQQLFSASWKAMNGWRLELLQLWLSLAGWLVLLLGSDLLARVTGHWAVSFLFYVVETLACVAVLPYVTLCGIFFSLRVIHR